VASAARESGQSAQLQWEGNCQPFIDTPLYVEAALYQRCMAVNATIIRWLSSPELKDVTGVVLAANWVNSQALLHAAGQQDGAKKFAAALGRTVGALRALGLRVLVLGQVPPLPYVAPECVYHAGLANDVAQCGARRSKIDGEQRDLLDALRAAVAPFDNARVLDLEPALCDAESCSPLRDGHIYYSDATHLSDAGARAVRAHFAEDFAWIFAPTERDRSSGAH